MPHSGLAASFGTKKGCNSFQEYSAEDVMLDSQDSGRRLLLYGTSDKDAISALMPDIGLADLEARYI